MADDPKERFGFGENWENFVKTRLNEERIDSAREKLLGSLMLYDLSGLVFLDIGCGSGLHSLAAFRSGAKQIISFDFDPDSVRTTRYLHEKAGSPENWTIFQGSVLDDAFMQTLPQADIVYSWGVLHHTGHVWKAIENAGKKLKSGGTFFIALYSYGCYENGLLARQPSPEKWLELKQAYNRSSEKEKRRMEWRYAFTSGFSHSLWNPLKTLRSALNVFRQMRSYHQSRGMDYFTDVRDWLGGWPMEFVKEQDCLKFCRDKLAMECVRLVTGEGNSEYLFRHAGVSNYWDGILARKNVLKLEGPFVRLSENAWQADIKGSTDLKTYPPMLSENSLLQGSAYSVLKATQKFGSGRFSLRRNRFYFSTSDNSDPNTNGRSYTLAWFDISSAERSGSAEGVKTTSSVS